MFCLILPPWRVSYLIMLCFFLYFFPCIIWAVQVFEWLWWRALTLKPKQSACQWVGLSAEHTTMVMYSSCNCNFLKMWIEGAHRWQNIYRAKAKVNKLLKCEWVQCMFRRGEVREMQGSAFREEGKEGAEEERGGWRCADLFFNFFFWRRIQSGPHISPLCLPASLTT